MDQSNKLPISVFAALYWFNYEMVKARLCEQSEVPQANFSISFTAGAVSGAVSTLHTCPLLQLLSMLNVRISDTCTDIAEAELVSAWTEMIINFKKCAAMENSAFFCSPTAITMLINLCEWLYNTKAPDTKVWETALDNLGESGQCRSHIHTVMLLEQ